MKYIKNTNEELSLIYQNCNQAYYNDGEPIMSDVDYDALQDEMNRRGIDTKSLIKGKYGDEVEHFTLCPSLRKVNVKGEFNKGHHADIIKAISKSPQFRKGSNYSLDFKMDGLAINAMYVGGKLNKAVTRGDYFVGRNVINKIKHKLPLTVDETVTEVRYECIIPMDIFVDKYADDYSHPRNLASGIINDEDMNDPRKDDLMLIPLNGVIGNRFMNSSYFPNNQDLLKPLELSYDDIIDFDTFKRLFDCMAKTRPTQYYPTDGIVLSPHTAMVDDTDGVKYPNHSVSIKFPPSGSKTVVERVEWNLKKSGEFIPKVFYTPIKIDGRVHRKCHGFNYGFIIANNIQKGAEITIEIAGDIIPYLSSVVKGSNVSQVLPKTKWSIDGCHLYSEDADSIKLERFIYSALKLELKGFGESFYRSVSSYYDYNAFNIFNKEYTNYNELLELGLGAKTINNFLDAVKNKKSMHLKDVIRTLAIDNCGDGTSEQVAKYLAKEVYGLDADEYEVDYDFARKQKDVVESCTNGSDKEYILSVIEQLNLDGVDVILALPKKSVKSDLMGFIMTGSPKGSTEFSTKGAFKKSLPSNYVEVKTMTKADVLITDDLTSTTTKMKDAKKRGVKIVSYKSFEEPKNMFNF